VEQFGAVVANRSLHHVTDLEVGLGKIRTLLEADGVLVLEEFAWDRLDDATAGWFFGQRRALAAAGRAVEGPSSAADWEDEHVGLHGYAAMREALDARFDECFFAWTPYLYRLLDGVTSEALERSLIDADAIRALGFRYAGRGRD
ncbi:MAG: hypothetical protein ACRDM9_11935, partial [Gaiellaceae bacterium]